MIWRWLVPAPEDEEKIMNVTLDYLKSNRKWLVRDYRVYGDDDAFEANMLITEITPSTSRIVFLHQYSGGIGQLVEFADLLDHRGNQLPSTISSAEVIIVPKNAVTAFIPGSVGPTSFRIAKSNLQPADAVVDLLIVEMN
jgi:hypothetical protein